MLNNRTCLGVDTSGNDIKVIELRRSRSGYEVVQAARIDVSSDDAGVALKYFLLETGSDPSCAVFALPANLCSIKFASLPKTNQTETARMARYEAETQFPLPLTDMVWAFSAEKTSKEEQFRQIILAGARRSLVQQTVQDAEASSLPLSALMITALAGVRSIRNRVAALGSTIVINISDEWTDITTVRDSKITSCRSIHLGINDLALGLASDLSISLPEAQEMVCDCPSLQSQSSSGYTSVGTQVNLWVDTIALEVRRSLLSDITKKGQNSLSSAILIGDGASVKWLSLALENVLDISVETGDPWQDMSLSQVVSYNKQDLPASYAVATGLAMAGLEKSDFINLMPQQRAEERSQKRKQITLISTFAMGAVLLFIVFLIGQSGIKAKSAELDDLKTQIKAVKRDSGHIDSGVTSNAASIKKIVSTLQDKKYSPVEILRTFSIDLPKSCWLSEFRFESGKSVILRGSALSDSAVADALYVISNSTIFENVSLDYSNLGKSADKSIYEFQIKCALPADSTFQKSTKNTRSSKARLVVR